MIGVKRLVLRVHDYVLIYLCILCNYSLKTYLLNWIIITMMLEQYVQKVVTNFIYKMGHFLNSQYKIVDHE